MEIKPSTAGPCWLHVNEQTGPLYLIRAGDGCVHYVHGAKMAEKIVGANHLVTWVTIIMSDLRCAGYNRDDFLYTTRIDHEGEVARGTDD